MTNQNSNIGVGGGGTSTPSSGGGGTPTDGASRALDNLQLNGGQPDNAVLQVDGSNIVAAPVGMDNLNAVLAALINSFVSATLTLEGNGDRVLTIIRQSQSDLVIRIPPAVIGLQNHSASLQNIFNNAFTGVNFVERDDGITIHFTNFLNSSLNQSVEITFPSGGGGGGTNTSATVVSMRVVVCQRPLAGISVNTWTMIPAVNDQDFSGAVSIYLYFPDTSTTGSGATQADSPFSTRQIDIDQFNNIAEYNSALTNADNIDNALSASYIARDELTANNRLSILRGPNNSVYVNFATSVIGEVGNLLVYKVVHTVNAVSSPASAPVSTTDDVVLASLTVGSTTISAQTWTQIPATTAETTGVYSVDLVIQNLSQNTAVNSPYTQPMSIGAFNSLPVYDTNAANAATNLMNACHHSAAIYFGTTPRTRSIAFMKGADDNSLWMYFHNAEFVPTEGTIQVLGKRLVAAATSASGSQTAEANFEEPGNAERLHTFTVTYDQLVLNNDTFRSLFQYTQTRIGSYLSVIISATGGSTGGARLLYRPMTFSSGHFSQTLLIGGVNGEFNVSVQISESFAIQTPEPKVWHIGLESVSGDGLIFTDVTITVSEYISLTEAGSTSTKSLFTALDKIDVPSASNLPIDLNQSIDLNAVNFVYTKLSLFDREAVHEAPSDLLKRYVVDRSGPNFATTSTTFGERWTLKFAMWTYITDIGATFGQGVQIPSGAGRLFMQFLHQAGNVNVIDSIVIYERSGLSGRLEIEIKVF